LLFAEIEVKTEFEDVKPNVKKDKRLCKEAVCNLTLENIGMIRILFAAFYFILFFSP